MRHEALVVLVAFAVLAPACEPNPPASPPPAQIWYVDPRSGQPIVPNAAPPGGPPPAWNAPTPNAAPPGGPPPAWNAPAPNAAPPGGPPPAWNAPTPKGEAPSPAWTPPPSQPGGAPPSPLAPGARPASTGPSNLTPFTRGPDLVFRERPDAVKKRVVAKDGWAARFAPDNRTYVFSSGTGKPIRLSTDANPSGILLPHTTATRTAFSPDSSLLATGDEDGTLTLWSAPSGVERLRRGQAFKTFGSFGSGKYAEWEVSFADNRTLLFHDGCRLRRMDVTTGTTTNISNADLCGRLRHSPNNVWLVADEWYGMMPQKCIPSCYRQAFQLDTTTGLGTKLVEGPFTGMQLAASGTRIVLTRPGPHMTFYDLAQGTEQEIVADNFDDNFAVDESGTHVVYAVKTGTSFPPPKDLYVADLGARTIRRLGRLSAPLRWWRFVAPNRFVAYGYDGAVLYDLAQGWTARLTPQGTDNSFLWPVPDGTRFMLANNFAQLLEFTPIP